jgi:hypothetical protein
VLVVLVVGGVVLVSRSDRQVVTTRVVAPPPSSTTAATAPRPGPDPHELEAEAAARALLTRVRPGPGWVEVATPPASILETAWSAPGTSNLVDLHRLYVVTGSWAAVQTWLQANAPAGTVHAGSGSTATRGVPTSQDIGYLATGEDPALVESTIQFTTAPAGPGHIGLRVDVQVTWRPSRPTDTFVPSGSSSVTVTAVWGAGATAGSLTRTVTDPTTIAELAGTVNGLSAALPGVHGCPAEIGNLRLRLHFTGPKMSTVLTESDGCDNTSLRDDAHPTGFALDTGSTLLDQEARALNTTMASLQARAVASATVPWH